MLSLAGRFLDIIKIFSTKTKISCYNGNENNTEIDR